MRTEAGSGTWDREGRGPGASPAITRRTVAAFGAGGAAIGITSSGLNVLLLLYYHQIMHLHPALAGLALAIGLVVDGVADPVVGAWSDRIRHRLGRRHPFLLTAIVPLALCYMLIWFPPAPVGDQAGLFAYLLVTSSALRLALTFFDVPANALVAELTRDYEARTRLSSAKISASWMMANLTGIMMYAIWLKDAPGAPSGSGILSAEGYRTAAFWLGGMVFVCAAALPLLLWNNIPYLRGVASAEPVVARRGGLKALASVGALYNERSIRALLATSLFLAVAQGVGQSLWVYLYVMFWGLAGTELNILQGAYLAAGVLVLTLLPRLARGRDKRRMALGVGAVFWVFNVAAVAARLAGVAPETGTALMVFLSVHALIDALLLNMLLSLKMSMLTDAVEAVALTSGRREEGAILAGQTLVSKVSSAMGTMLAAGVLALIAFPEDATLVTRQILQGLGGSYVVLVLTMGAASMTALWGYRITRSQHHHHVATLEARAGADPHAPGSVASTSSIASDQ